MADLFDDEKAILEEDDLIPPEDVTIDSRHRPVSDARRRLEDLLEEKRLRDELEELF